MLLALLVLLCLLLCSVSEAQQITITPVVPNPGSIIVSATPALIAVGGTSVLTAQVFDTNGNPNIFVTDRCGWTSSNPAVLLVSGTVVIGLTTGTANVTCTLGTLVSTPLAINIVVAGVSITNPVCGTPPCVLPGGTNGGAYPGFTFTATGANTPFTWTFSASNLAACGLTLSSGGVVSGTMTTAVCTPTVLVTDASSNTASIQVSVTVVSSSATCGPPTYSCSSTSAVNAGTIASIFTATSPTTTTCSGDCQNTTRYDTTINPTGTDPYTRVTDGTTACTGFTAGLSMQSSPSSGDNDNTWSLNDDYQAVETVGGVWCILHLSVPANAPVQVLNTGRPVVHGVGGFTFSRVADKEYFYKPTPSSITHGILATDAGSTTENSLIDVTTAGVCPGLPSPFTTTSGTILTNSLTDDTFGWGISNTGNQDTAVWGVAYSKTKGCTVANFQTGQVWGWCISNCTPSTAALGTMSGCYGGTIHQTLMSLDGQYLYITMVNPGAWTNCPGTTANGTYSVWKIGTLTSQFCDGRTPSSGGTGCQSHTSVGYSHSVSNDYKGVTIRPNSNVATYTLVGPPYLPIPEDWHSAWPNPDTTDSMPLIVGTDLVSLANGGPLAPVALHNEIFIVPIGTAYPPGGTIRRIGHTFECGNTGAVCPSGGDAYFGAYDGIMNCSQSGKHCALSSTMLGTLGLDNGGKRRMDVFDITLE